MEKYRATAERAFALMNAHDLAQLKSVFADSCEVTMPGMPPVRGPEAFAQVVGGWISAFPDLKHEIVGYVEEGDRASWQVRVTGTHTGPLPTPDGPVPATGKRIKIDALDVARFENGKAVSWHVYFDQLPFLQQLGLAPA
jgi:predicted ester cyclase